jgi:teichuronic acid biosynthesis glycosyltransferase TuaG
MDRLCSIITPAYNSASFIARTIGSVLMQTYPDWEMIVVDDCSTDGVGEVVAEEAEKDGRIRLIRNARRLGQAASRNTAIEAARGRFIAFLDSDDIWAPMKLERQISFMEKERCPLSFTAYKKIDERDFITSCMVEVPKKVDYRGLLKTNVIPCLTAVYDTRPLGRVFMRLGLKAHEDHLLWLDILKRGYEARGLNECLGYYRIREGSVSRNKARAALCQWKVYREFERLPLHESVYYFATYAYHGYRKSRL